MYNEKIEALKEVVRSLDDRNTQLQRENEALKYSQQTYNHKSESAGLTSSQERLLAAYEVLGTPDEVNFLIDKFESYAEIGSPSDINNYLDKVESFLPEGGFAAVKSKLEEYDKLKYERKVESFSAEYSLPREKVETVLSKVKDENDARDLLDIMTKNESRSRSEYRGSRRVVGKVKLKSESGSRRRYASSEDNNLSKIRSLINKL